MVAQISGTFHAGPGGITGSFTETHGPGGGGWHHHHHHHSDSAQGCGYAQGSGSAQGMINHGNQLVQKGQQEIQNGQVVKGERDIQRGENLINQGSSQLAAQSAPPCPPSGSGDGQSSNPLQAALQGFGDIAKLFGGGGGVGASLGNCFSFASMLGM